MSNNRGMRTLQQLRDLLADMNIQALAAASGVNAKTIYRINKRHEYMPGAGTVEKLSEAIDRMAVANSRKVSQ